MSAALVGTDAWLLERRTALGASEVGTALGLVPDSDYYSRPIDIYLDKIGDERISVISKSATEAGKRLEQPLRDWYAELAGKRIESPQSSLRHPDHNWISCTPDSLTVERDLNIQIKMVGARQSFSWPGQCSVPDDDSEIILNSPDGIPMYYRCQVEWEMGILHALYGIERTHLVALLGGTDLRIYDVPRDPSLWAALVENASKFWFDHVVPRIPPPPDGSEAFKEYLYRCFPKATRPDLDPMPPEVEASCRAYLKANETLKKVTGIRDLAANEIREKIGEGNGYIGNDIKAVWRNTKVGRTLDVKLIGEAKLAKAQAKLRG